MQLEHPHGACALNLKYLDARGYEARQQSRRVGSGTGNRFPTRILLILADASKSHQDELLSTRRQDHAASPFCDAEGTGLPDRFDPAAN